MSSPGGHVEGFHVRVAEATVGGTVHSQGMGFQYPARGCKNVDDWAWAALFPSGADHDVAFGVQSHSVDAPLHSSMIDAESMQSYVVAQRAVIIDWIGPQLAGMVEGIIALGHVKGFLIAGYQNAVGAADVVGSPG